MKGFAVSLAGVLAGLSCLGAESFTIAADGKPAAEIVIGEKPVKSARFAAAELRHVVELVTGAKLPVLARPTRKGGAIFVGCGTDEKFAGEEYAVRFRDGNVVLTGHDEADFGEFDYARRETFPAITYCFRSTTYAVYDFLERYCGVRFYGFGDEGIAFRPSRTLKVMPDGGYRRKPGMDAFRKMDFEDHGRLLDIPDRDRDLLLLRWRINCMFGEVNHSVMGIWYRYYKRSVRHPQANCFIESRPDYFAEGYKGKNAPFSLRRWDYPGDVDIPPQLCTSSEGPVEYFADEALRMSRGEKVPCTMAYFAKRMEGEPYYYPVQEDDSNYWCQCKRCKGNPKLKDYLVRHFDWVGRIARRVAEKDPSVGIGTLAYSDTLQYPKGLDLPRNLMVQMCLAPQSWFHPNVYACQHGAYRDWVANEGARRPLTLWLYLLNPWAEAQNPHNYGKFFPVVYPHHMGAFMREFLKDGIRGFYGEATPRYHLLELYIMAKMADRAETDPEALLDEYYGLYYGKAGPAMRAFSDTLEKESYDIANYSDAVKAMKPKNSYVYCLHAEKDNWFLGSRERVDRLDRMFRVAEAAAATPLERRRVADYRERIWNTAVEGRRDFERREKVRKIPLPFGVSARGGFDEAHALGDFRTLDNAPAKAASSVALANDDESLFIEFREPGGEAYARRTLSEAENGFECYLSTFYENNFICIHARPNGMVSAERCELRFGGSWRKDSLAVPFTESKADADGWRVRIMVPFRLIPPGASKSSRLRGNFIRARGWPGGETTAWSPTFTADRYEGVRRLGTFILSEATPYGRLQVKPEEWTISDVTHGLKPGEEFSYKDGVLRMRSGTARETLYAYQTKPIVPVQPGERIVFDFDARGQTPDKDWKPACAAFQLAGNAYSAGLATGSFEVTSEWSHHRITVVATEGNGAKRTTLFRPGFCVFNGGALSVKNLKIAVCK